MSGQPVQNSWAIVLFFFGKILLNQATSSKLQLVAFPGYGYVVDSEHWRVQIEGVVRLPYAATIRKRMVLRILGNVMGVPEEQLLSEQYFPRIKPFVSDGAKHQQVSLEIGDYRFILPRKTKRNGHFSQTVFLPQGVIEECRQMTASQRSYVDVRMRCEGAWNEAGCSRIYLMPKSGTSVISDIDDTIKNSAINDRKELLANTFLRPFQSVDGMADVYRQWEQMGMDFHYVSSSPWQLLPPISEMLTRDAFPEGSVHLRYFRLRNHMLQRMVRIKRSGKITSLRNVVKTMPDRNFLLIGDSGEKDLELYRNLVKKYRARILAVCIRNLSSNPLPTERVERFQNQCPGTPLIVFGGAQELSESVRALNVPGVAVAGN